MAIKHEESQQPNNSLVSQTRRSVLKKILVGTGVAAGAAALPDKWVKPMVDKVLVPAHAQTSPLPTEESNCGECRDSSAVPPSGDDNGVELTYEGDDGTTAYLRINNYDDVNSECFTFTLQIQGAGEPIGPVCVCPHPYSERTTHPNAVIVKVDVGGGNLWVLRDANGETRGNWTEEFTPGSDEYPGANGRTVCDFSGIN